MSAPAWIALAVTAGFAVVDWVAVGRSVKAVEYVAKPATLAALTGGAVLLDPADDARRAWFVVALAWSLAGDVFLMLPRDRFVPGLASFLVGHLAYTVGFRIGGGSAAAVGWSALVIAAMAVPLGVRIVRSARARDPRLAVPVAAYIVVISAMVSSAIATGDAWAIAGALLFYCSDAFIGWSRFVTPFVGHRLAIMVTYHVGQMALVASLLD